MKIDDSTFFLEKKMGQDLSYNLYSEIFSVLKVFK